MTQAKNIDILGAGIMGLMSAYTLCQQNHNITIYDPKGFPAKNASFMAGGMLAPYSEIEHMDQRWIKASLQGIETWKNLKLNTGFIQKGSLLIACPEDHYILKRFKTHLPTHLRASQNIQSLEQQIPQTFQNGLYLNQEAHLDPQKTMKSLCAFLSDKITLISSAQTPENSNADWVIDCRGTSSADCNIRSVKGEIAIVHNTDFKLSRPVRVMHPRYPLYVVPRENNIFMIGATIIESAENETVSLRSSMELMSALYALHPSFGDAEIIEIKAGMRPSYPDNLPRITFNHNIISCNGLFRHGYLLSPVMAQSVADFIKGSENDFMHLFRKEDDENHNQRAA